MNKSNNNIKYKVGTCYINQMYSTYEIKRESSRTQSFVALRDYYSIVNSKLLRATQDVRSNATRELCLLTRRTRAFYTPIHAR